MPTTTADYRRRYDPASPMAHKDGCVRKHRLAAAKKLGRPLRRDEYVHHLDGDPDNNEPGNLAVMSNSKHVALHWKQGDYAGRRKSKWEGGP